MKVAIRLLIILITLTLAACGGGGGGGVSGGVITPPPSSKTSAVLKIGTQGTLPAGVLFTGIGVTITLPKGVTVIADGNNNVGVSVATASGVAQGLSIPVPVYTPATSTANATLYIVVSDGVTLFGTGEFVTVNLILPAGNSLTVNDFTTAIVSKFEPSGPGLGPVAGITPTCLATLN